MKKILLLIATFTFFLLAKNVYAASDISCDFRLDPAGGPPNTSFNAIGTNCHAAIPMTGPDWATRRILVRISDSQGTQIGGTAQASLDTTDPNAVSFSIPLGGLTTTGSYTIDLEDEVGSIIATQIFTISGEGPVMPTCGSTVGSGGSQPPTCDPQGNVTGACCPFFCPALRVYDQGELNYRWVCTGADYLCSRPDTGLPGINTAIGCVPIENTNDLLSYFVRWTVGIIGGIALLLIIFASYQIITSQGDKYKLQSGKDMLTAAITGLILAIFAIFVVQLFGQDILHIF